MMNVNSEMSENSEQCIASTMARIRTCDTKHSKYRFSYLGHPTSYEKRADFKVKNHQITVGYSQLQFLQVFQCNYYKLKISQKQKNQMQLLYKINCKLSNFFNVIIKDS